MTSIEQRIQSAALRVASYRDREFYSKRKAAGNQMSLWGDEEEKQHPRNDAGEFKKKEESSVILSQSDSVKPSVAETKPEVKEEMKMNTGNGSVDRDALMGEIMKEVGHLTDARCLKEFMEADTPLHLPKQETKYKLDNPHPIPSLLEKMVIGGFVTSDLPLYDMNWPSTFRKWQDAIGEWRKENPKTDEIKFMGGRVQITDPKIGSIISVPIEETTVEGINKAVKVLRKNHKETAKVFRGRVAAERSVNNE